MLTFILMLNVLTPETNYRLTLEVQCQLKGLTSRLLSHCSFFAITSIRNYLCFRQSENKQAVVFSLLIALLCDAVLALMEESLSSRSVSYNAIGKYPRVH